MCVLSFFSSWMYVTGFRLLEFVAGFWLWCFVTSSSFWSFTGFEFVDFWDPYWFAVLVLGLWNFGFVFFTGFLMMLLVWMVNSFCCFMMFLVFVFWWFFLDSWWAFWRFSRFLVMFLRFYRFGWQFEILVVLDLWMFDRIFLVLF